MARITGIKNENFFIRNNNFFGKYSALGIDFTQLISETKLINYYDLNLRVLHTFF